jgi:hypothetical protein
MKILVIGGMHGNEPLGIKLVTLLREKPIKNVDSIYANEKAIKANFRFIKSDLNRSFPGDIKSTDYEVKRAAEILFLCSKYDLVLDFHNTKSKDNNCTFLGETAKEFLYDISNWLGFKRVIVANYNCINKFANNCLSVEISMNNKKINIRTLYAKLSTLVKMNSVAKVGNIYKYKFIYRITIEDRDKYKLRNKKLKAFKPINRKLASLLNVDSPAYPIFVGDGLTPFNYGGLLNKIK